MRLLVSAVNTLTFVVLVVLVACGGGSSNGGNGNKEQQNAVPVIQSLAPSTAPAGSADLTVQINGTGFMTTSSVQWAGAARNCNFVSNSSISCAVTAADMSAPGNANISVTNPAPGGGTATASFVIGSPDIPKLGSISPSSIAPGSGSFTLTANGSGFTRKSTVLWSGSARQTTYVSNLQLTAQIDAADVTSAGVFPVSVSTPSPGGGASQPMNANVEYPAPIISSLTPNAVVIQSSGFILTINGANFYPGATVSWNRVARVTTYVSATQLTASIPSGDLNVASGTTANIYVTNPSPSAGISNIVQIALQNPVPTITAISPDAGIAGDFTDVQITGTNFFTGAIVQLEGRTQSTRVLSSTSLSASVQASKVGPNAVTVTNPTPNAGPSTPVEFEGNAAGEPMNPQLVTIDPAGQPVSSGIGVSSPGRYASFGSRTGSFFMRDTCLGISSGCTPSTVAAIASGMPSDDGRFVAFLGSTGPTSVYLQLRIADLCTGVASCTPSFVNAPVSPSYLPSSGISPISASGRYVPFKASYHMSPSTIGIYDFCSNAVSGCAPGLISLVDFSAVAAPVISRDARYSVFDGSMRDTCIGAAPGCVPATTPLILDPQANCGQIAISRNAAYAAYICNDEEIQVVNTCTQGVQGCSTAPIATISYPSANVQYLAFTQSVWISDSGRYVAWFGSSPSKLLRTAMVSDTCIGAASGCQLQTTFACLNTEGALANDFCYLDGMSDDGKYIYYHSAATNLAAGLGGYGSYTGTDVLSYGYAVANPLQ
jgi:hypothetical protein